MKAFVSGVVVAVVVAVATGFALDALNPTTAAVFYGEDTYPETE